MPVDADPRSPLRTALGVLGKPVAGKKARAIHIVIAQTLPKIYQQIEEWR
jgi:hypothetical protein